MMWIIIALVFVIAVVIWTFVVIVPLSSKRQSEKEQRIERELEEIKQSIADALNKKAEEIKMGGNGLHSTNDGDMDTDRIKENLEEADMSERTGNTSKRHNCGCGGH